MAEEPSLSYYLPIAEGRIIGFIPFPRVLVLCEMQSVSSRIWTRVAVFISYGDNDYTTPEWKVAAISILGKDRFCSDHKQIILDLGRFCTNLLPQVTQRPPAYSSCFLAQAQGNILPWRNTNQRLQNFPTPKTSCRDTQVTPSSCKQYANKRKTTIFLARVGC